MWLVVPLRGWAAGGVGASRLHDEGSMARGGLAVGESGPSRARALVRRVRLPDLDQDVADRGSLSPACRDSRQETSLLTAARPHRKVSGSRTVPGGNVSRETCESLR